MSYTQLNSLNLIFGPRLPVQLENVGISYIAGPFLSADSDIGVFNSERYAVQNYPQFIPAIGLPFQTNPNQTIQVSYSLPSVSKAFNAGGYGSAYLSGSQTTDENGYWGFPVIDDPITVKGVKISNAKTWFPIVKPGVVWREGYVINAIGSGVQEPSGSWLSSAFPPNNTSYNLVLIYTVPEVNYTVTSKNSTLTWPPYPEYFTKENSEIVSLVAPTTLKYLGDLDILEQIIVDGVVKFSGTFTDNEVDSVYNFVSSIDKSTGNIYLKQGLDPTNLVEIKYKNYSSYYYYSGFRDASGNWWPFDLNPEYGHLIGDNQTGLFRNSSDCLINEITLYAIPSAALLVNFTPASSSNNMIPTLSLQFYRAVDYGETHFIRHLVSNTNQEIISTSRDNGTVINTWGYATFGRNYYDEPSNTGDIFSTVVPSMLPIGRFVLAAPQSAQGSVSVADIRQRGGGIPPDFPITTSLGSSGALVQIRSFFDMACWEGKAVKEGGVIQVQIDPSILKTNPNDTNPYTFTSDEINQIVQKNVPPGIDYKIVYTTVT